MSFDPQVWTSDLPASSGWYFVKDSGPAEFRIGQGGAVVLRGVARICALDPSHPSAEEIAALEECAAVLRDSCRPLADNHCDYEARADGSTGMNAAAQVLSAIDSALARLEACRG